MTGRDRTDIKAEQSYLSEAKARKSLNGRGLTKIKADLVKFFKRKSGGNFDAVRLDED